MGGGGIAGLGRSRSRARQIITRVMERIASRITSRRPRFPASCPPTKMKGRIVGAAGTHDYAPSNRPTGVDLRGSTRPRRSSISSFDPIRARSPASRYARPGSGRPRPPRPHRKEDREGHAARSRSRSRTPAAGRDRGRAARCCTQVVELSRPAEVPRTAMADRLAHASRGHAHRRHACRPMGANCLCRRIGALRMTSARRSATGRGRASDKSSRTSPSATACRPTLSTSSRRTTTRSTS